MIVIRRLTKERDKRGESEKESSIQKKEPACDELMRPARGGCLAMFAPFEP
jgi:hypothetical protein